MELPQNARVIVVDNDPDDVSDLLACLAQKGVATLYYKGRSVFPKAPWTGIRLLFLDLELDDVKGQTDKMKVAAATSVYQALIAPNNGPLVLIVWTDHRDLYKSVRSAISKVAQNPVFVGCMGKTDCRIGKHFSITRIRQKLTEVIKKADVFGLYVSWENVVHKATVNQASRLSSIARTGRRWSEHMSYALHCMYKAYTEKNQVEDVRQQLASAWLLHNACFTSEIANALNDFSVSLSKGFKLKESGLSQKVQEQLIGKINAMLLYNFKKCPLNEPGTVYRLSPDKIDPRLRKLKQAIIRDFSVESKETPGLTGHSAILCKIIITPQCDVAQKKCMGITSAKPFCRIVWGLLIQGQHNMTKFKPKGKARCYSEFRNFEYNNRRCALLIDLDTVEMDVTPLDSSSKMFVLNPIPLADIQTKAANVLNRVGVSVAD